MRCGNCGYRLRGLTDERCSDCGSIVDPSKTLPDDPPSFPKRAIIWVWIIAPLAFAHLPFVLDVDSLVGRLIGWAVAAVFFGALGSAVLVLDWRFMSHKRRD